MKNKKVLALLVSLVLIVAVVLPGTLAVSSDQDGVDGSFTVPEEPVAPIDPEQPVVEQPEQPVVEQPEQPAVEQPEQPAVEQPEQPVVEQPEQPVVEQPEQPVVEQPEQPAMEQETPEEEPVVITHLDTCLEDCTGEECACGCHLFDKIMKCETLDEIWALFDAASEEAINALTDEQNAQIDAKIEALEPAPVPAVVIEQTKETTVPSEIVYPTVNYTNVAPFGAPATGGQG